MEWLADKSIITMRKYLVQEHTILLQS